MTGELLIEVENVSKKFCRSLKESLRYGIQDIASELTQKKIRKSKLRKNEFWAIDDVSFQLRRGECLGLIGANGSGKTTLLRMINGLIRPDKGKITIRGRVGALIALGTGFNPVLTGKENVFAAGAVLGLTTHEINRKYDSIVEFAELEDFMDTPVQNYSSGMQVRLGFAVAVQMEPDVLILDEVLAVGDMAFQAKCFNAVHRIIQNSAVVFVSHSMHQVSRVCSQVMRLDKGKQLYWGNEVAAGIRQYSTQSVKELRCELSGNGLAKVHDLVFETNGKKSTDVVKYGELLAINCEATVDKKIENPGIAFAFLTPDMRIVAQCVSYFNEIEIMNDGSRMNIRVDLGPCTLAPGVYWLMVAIQGNELGEILVRYMNYKKIEIHGWFNSYCPIQMTGNWEINRN